MATPFGHLRAKLRNHRDVDPMTPPMLRTIALVYLTGCFSGAPPAPTAAPEAPRPAPARVSVHTREDDAWVNRDTREVAAFIHSLRRAEPRFEIRAAASDEVTFHSRGEVGHDLEAVGRRAMERGTWERMQHGVVEAGRWTVPGTELVATVDPATGAIEFSLGARRSVVAPAMEFVNAMNSCSPAAARLERLHYDPATQIVFLVFAEENGGRPTHCGWAPIHFAYVLTFR